MWSVFLNNRVAKHGVERNHINNIRTIIREKGYLQKSVANRAGYSKQTFNNMLNGRRAIRADEIPRIASALGCESSDLYDDHAGQAE